MNTKRVFILSITALLASSITACVLKKSTPPPQNLIPDQGEETLFPEPETQENPLEKLSPLATQTALGSGEHTIDLTPNPINLTPGFLTPAETVSGTRVVPTLQPLLTTIPGQLTIVAVTVPPPTPGVPATYTLQQGEFPYCIARRFNVNVGTLLSLNGLNSGSKPAAGFALKIPQDGVPFGSSRALHNHPTTYNVITNDTIYSVACYYGDVDPMVIAQVNNLQPPYTLTPGQSLNIP
jgi:LysM repeat protein